jgi:hypothetical protein
MSYDNQVELDTYLQKNNLSGVYSYTHLEITHDGIINVNDEILFTYSDISEIVNTIGNFIKFILDSRMSFVNKFMEIKNNILYIELTSTDGNSNLDYKRYKVFTRNGKELTKLGNQINSMLNSF